MKKFSLIVGAVLAVVALFAETAVSVKADRDTALYQAGELVFFGIGVVDGDKTLPDIEFEYALNYDGKWEKGKLVSGKQQPYVLGLGPKVPGFVLCRVKATVDGKTIEQLGGAGYDVKNIRLSGSEPADFDAFWQKAKDELKSVPMNPVLTEIPSAPEVKAYDVQLGCPGGRPVSGYLAIPVDKSKKYPIWLSYQGAGVRSSSRMDGRAKQGFLAMDINAHGIANGKDEAFYTALAQGELKGYSAFGVEDKDQYYFRGMFQRVLRSLEYMKSLPEWDGKNIVVAGGSQGGAQSLVAAALDPDVTVCVAWVPAMIDQFGQSNQRNGSWPYVLKMENGQYVNPKIAETVKYYDTGFFARRIKNAKCYLSTGFIDTTCPPVTVYAAFNEIPAPVKTIHNDIAWGHKTPPETYTDGANFAMGQLK